MMKALLEFNRLEEEQEFLAAVHGRDLALVIWDLLHKDIRDWLKHGHGFSTPEEALEAIRSAINEGLMARGIDLSALVE